MKESELVTLIVKRTGQDRAIVRLIMRSMLDEITVALGKHEPVRLVNFGEFRPSHVRAVSFRAFPAMKSMRESEKPHYYDNHRRNQAPQAS